MSQSKKRIRSSDWERKVMAAALPPAAVDRVVMDFLSIEGFKDAAESFAAESGVQPAIPLDEVERRMCVKRAVESGAVSEAVSLLNELDPEILDANPALSFHMQVQMLIELVRQGRIDDALTLAQEEVAAQGEEHPEFLPELEEVLALLAFHGLKDSPYAHLLEPIQRERLAAEINTSVLGSQGRDTQPRLVRTLRTLLWAQTQLLEKTAFPTVKDLATAEIESSSTK